MSNNRFRERRAEDLSRLATALERERMLSCDVRSLNHAASLCSLPGSNSDSSWGYEIEGLIFRQPEEQDHVQPVGAVLTQLELNLHLSGPCDINGEIVSDPLHTLGVELIMWGSRDDGATLKAAWYMDRNPNWKLPVHPRYHVQFGGRNIKRIDSGEIILCPTPRLAHPPLDAILAVDLVLSNYFTEAWMSLREESEYYRLVRDAQQRLWRPYAQAVQTGWGRKPADDGWEVVDNWPQVRREEREA